MTRGIASGLLTALQALVVRPVYLVKMEFTGSDLYLSSTIKNISYDSQTWLGNGLLKSSFDGVHEVGDVQATGVKIKLEAYDAALMSLLLTGLTRSKTASIYIGALDSSHDLVLSPQLIYKGFFDSVAFGESGNASEAIVSYENELITLRNINEFRYTHESQQIYFPGDLCFQYTDLIADWSGFWGKAAKVKRIKKRDKNKN